MTPIRKLAWYTHILLLERSQRLQPIMLYTDRLGCPQLRPHWYLQFWIQVCFPCIGQPVTHRHLWSSLVTVTDTRHRHRHLWSSLVTVTDTRHRHCHRHLSLSSSLITVTDTHYQHSSCHRHHHLTLVSAPLPLSVAAAKRHSLTDSCGNNSIDIQTQTLTHIRLMMSVL